jgi:hypothetical protein
MEPAFWDCFWIVAILQFFCKPVRQQKVKTSRKTKTGKEADHVTLFT